MDYQEQHPEGESGDNGRTEEDQIIELLGMEGGGALFEDTDFIPNRQSLYDNEGFIPYYDTDVTNFIVWKRPHEFCALPCYFHESFTVPSVIQGTLLDEVFVGILSAVTAMDEGELVENIVYSRPDDFQQYGVFTCRFYVEGAWVEVITDTRIPCLHHEASNKFVPVYSRSSHKKELWVTLIQKAYAKALGSYEAISKVRVSDLLIHLTGGSVQEIRFHEEGGHSGGSGGMNRDMQQQFAKKLKKMLDSGTLIVAKPVDNDPPQTSGGHGQHDRGSVSGNDQDGGGMQQDLEGLVPDKYYTVLALKEVNISELVLLHYPWYTGDDGLDWEGDWSDGSAKWDEYPEVLQAVHDDPTIKWTRTNPQGFMWISFKDFVRLFQGVHCCQLFNHSGKSSVGSSNNNSDRIMAGSGHNSNYYFDKGEFRDKHAGGPMVSIRDRDHGLKSSLRVEHEAVLKATASVIVDGDSSWFNNPQYKINCSSNTRVTISLIPVSLGEDTGGAGDVDALAASASSLPMVQLTVAELPKGTSQDAPFIGDALLCGVVATDRGEHVFRQRGAEASIWNLRLTANKNYFIIPSTARRGQTCGYVLRVFASGPVNLEKVPPLHEQCRGGEWAKSSTLDTTGGPPRLLVGGDEGGEGGMSATASSKKHWVDNGKWCQNSQFHLRLDDADAGNSDDVYLKVVLRRTDRSSSRQQTTGTGGGSSSHPECHVGFVVVKPEMLEEQVASKSKLGKPRLNPFGDVIASKPSSLIKESASSKNIGAKEQYLQEKKNTHDGKITRKLALDPLYFSETSTYSHKSEACMYFPRVPRTWMPDGLLIIPSLSEKGARGTYDLEVYASKPIVLQQIKDQRCKSVAGDWTEGMAGGSHICPTWKRNPRFELNLKYPLNRGTTNGNNKSCPVRISLCKSGSSWRSMSKAAAVACMVGFYVFVVTRSESGEQLRQIYETDFAPTAEVSTEAGFELDYILNSHETYLIMPTTFEDGKLGSFVLTVSADCDFTLNREHTGSSHK